MWAVMLLFAATEAWPKTFSICECGAGGGDTLTFFAVPEGAEGVPRNTGIWVVSDGEDDAFDEQFEFRAEDGEVLPFEAEMSRVFAGRGAGFLGPAEPLPGGTRVDAYYLPYLERGPITSWRTGEEIDSKAPVWSGDYSVDASRDNVFDCGRSYRQEYRLTGVSDDWSAPSEILQRLDSTEVGVDLYGRTGDPPRATGSDWCPVSAWTDSSLDDHWNRRYDVELADLAGNATVVGKAGTRHGCASSSARPSLAACLLSIGLAWGRRRR